MSTNDIRGHFRNLRETSEGFKADCPACDDTDRCFAFNESKRIGCCFHAHCIWFHEKGGATELRLQGFFSKNGIPYKIPDIKKTKSGDVELPEDFELIEDLPAHLGEDLIAYLEGRGLKQRIVEAAQVGYCQDGKLWGYLIFPVVDEEGTVQYWQARRYKNRNPKFRNPTSTKKSELVYRLNVCAKPKRIVLVESIINAMTITSLTNRRDLVLGIFGKTISDIQRDYVLQYQKWLQEVVVALDGPQERDNTKHAAVKIAKDFEGTVPAVKIAKFPEGEDVNSVGREKAWKIIDGAEAFHRNRNEQSFLHGEWK